MQYALDCNITQRKELPNKGGLFLNKGGLLINKGGLLQNKGGKIAITAILPTVQLHIGKLFLIKHQGVPPYLVEST